MEKPILCIVLALLTASVGNIASAKGPKVKPSRPRQNSQSQLPRKTSGIGEYVEAHKLRKGKCAKTSADDTKNIDEFGFKLSLSDGNKFLIKDGDVWYLHKALDGKTVCFVLTVQHIAGSPEPIVENFRGNVPCPDVCGVNNLVIGKLPDCDEIKKNELTPITPEVANALITPQHQNLIYTLEIQWISNGALQFLKDNVLENPGYCVIVVADPVTGKPPGQNILWLCPFDAKGNAIQGSNGAIYYQITDLFCLGQDGLSCPLTGIDPVPIKP